MSDVKCPKCGRYMGAFIGKAQCASCKTWVDVPKPIAVGLT